MPPVQVHNDSFNKFLSDSKINYLHGFHYFVFWYITRKVAINGNCVLKIHSKPDRNSQKLILCNVQFQCYMPVLVKVTAIIKFKNTYTIDISKNWNWKIIIIWNSCFLEPAKIKKILFLNAIHVKAGICNGNSLSQFQVSQKRQYQAIP